ncbi:MAG: F0F1 ATP synthase subunit gamma [Erysipelotrichaceae bacterium]|nr:F0F1 ATP synthase subunit gamma [Erysipelotrichaceae bacterium]
MGSIKNVVKVMNFHSLLRVDKARKRAENYLKVGNEITTILSEIFYNKNLVLDKQALIPNPSMPILDIYIANDYGYCGDFNSSVRRAILKNPNNDKIIIGKKIVYKDDKTVLKIEKDDFSKRFVEIQHYIEKSLIDMAYSEINIYYNHYYTSTTFEFKKIKVFPIEFSGEYYEGNDFVAETDLQKMLKSLVSFYICYQLKMCECISEAAENLNRNQITRMALDKIEEKEVEDRNAMLRKKNEEACFKNVENYKKIIQIGDVHE